MAAVSLHFGKIPTELDSDQIHDYLFYLQKKSKSPSQSYFKHTVYGLRFLLKSEGLSYDFLSLPEIKKEKKLPVVLSNRRFGRYTHKIAISNQRIRKIDAETVTFSYKDYRQKGIKKQMVLSHEEFIRRFAMHILPKRFVKIRHYGFLSSTWKRIKLKKLQQKLGIQPKEKLPPKAFQPKCSCCKVGNLVTIATFDLRGPPSWFLEMSRNLQTPKI